MQSVSFRIWIRATVSISYDDKHFTTGTSKELSSDIWSLFYAEFKNTIHRVWSGLVFKMCLNTSQVVHNDNASSKARGLYLLKLIVSVWCLVWHIMLYVYITTVYSLTPTRGLILKMFFMYRVKCQRRAKYWFIFFSFQLDICIPVRMDRKSKNNPDRFCYVHGNAVLPNRQAKITDLTLWRRHISITLELT